ncbi:hypothetical protein AVEN_109812-1 [Araneus ventricosus]|uniref:Uncharacterized protein n=1 Tax=Araneus ventricosus TaxID=182803 RepID=A0A4Y2GIA0_ARAVE|nr:hypothetical protein AVEN_109812-1 [Araneus ventricosus]
MDRCGNSRMVSRYPQQQLEFLMSLVRIACTSTGERCPGSRREWISCSTAKSVQCSRQQNQKNFDVLDRLRLLAERCPELRSAKQNLNFDVMDQLSTAKIVQWLRSNGKQTLLMSMDQCETAKRCPVAPSTRTKT